MTFEESLIISGYQGVGKSTFAKENEEISSIDFESSAYDKSDKNWHIKYVDDILKIENTDIIFISSHQAVRDRLNELGIKFVFVLPAEHEQHQWTKMLAQRVQDTIDNDVEREKNIRALMSHILYYDNIIQEIIESTTTNKRPFESVWFITHPKHFTDLIFYDLI